MGSPLADAVRDDVRDDLRTSGRGDAVTVAGGHAVHRVVGGNVLIEGVLRSADVVLDEGRIATITETARGDPGRGEPSESEHPGAEILDARGAIVAPGFVDLQCNGAGGTDLTADVATDAAAVDRVARALPRFGVTSFLPTVVTSPRHVRAAAVAALHQRIPTGDAPDTPGGDRHVHEGATPPRNAMRNGIQYAMQNGAVGAAPIGLHFEGPMISIDHLGAHTRRFVTAPEPDEVDAWIDSGVVSLVTLAPEVDGALEIVGRLADAGITVSAGHTAMSPEIFARARDAGLSFVTHLFNAMAPFGHRRPGPIGAALADDHVRAGLICDGLHVDPVAVRMAWRALGPHRMVLVSDAAAPLGTPFGTFRLGTFDVVYDDTGVRTADGVLAGSALALDQAVRNLVEFTGCSLVEALATVTTTPADLLGLTDRGRVAVGHHADLTILEPDGRLRATIVGGRLAWRS